MALPEARKVTHEMAREAYFKIHNAIYCGGATPTLTIPRSLNDVDCILCDYIEQQEELDRLPVGDARLVDGDRLDAVTGTPTTVPSPHKTAMLATMLWHERYAFQLPGSLMDFWDSLTESERTVCRSQLSDLLGSPDEEHEPDCPKPKAVIGKGMHPSRQGPLG